VEKLIMMNQPRKNSTYRFYEIEQQKLLLDFEKISLFTSHPSSLGTFRESRLRQYLRDFTPKQLSMGTGFISLFETEGMVFDRQSRQVDCLVFDETRRHPELRTDDYVIIRPEAFFAAIEVKSDLTFYKQICPKGGNESDYPLSALHERFRWAGTLMDALRNIKSIVEVMPAENHRYFTGVFGYKASFDFQSLYRALDNGEIQRQIGLNHIDELPMSVCVPGKFLIHFSPYDMMESAPHHDSYSSFMNVFTPLAESAAYPLQFFTIHYLNQIGAALTGEVISAGGLNSGKSPGVGVWRQRFDLNSEGHEDQ
jgi:hypothetical protein